MGLEIEMDLDKISTVGLSPNTVLPPPRHCSNIQKRKTKGKHIRRDELLRVREGFTEISFRRCRSSSCKTIPCGPIGLEGSIELKRGSIYQTSNEVRKMKKMGAIEGRKKIEFSSSSDTSLPSRVLDSLCSSDEESSLKRISVMSVNSTSNTSSACKPFIELCSAGDFIEFGLDLDTREKQSAETPRRDTVEDLNFRCGEVVGPLNDGNKLLERDTILTFQKSHSAKVEMTYPPSPSESDRSSRVSSKTHFNPIRKMFDPLMKSKSVRSPLCQAVQHNQVKNIGTEYVRREREFRKSLLHDFSNTAQNSEFNSQIVKKDKHHLAVANSPVHLHGLLKLEQKQGLPLFEFSLNSPEDVIVARTWKADNAFNWVYTFHSFDGRKRSNASGWGSNDCNRECSMVGQMQVSCYICSELRDAGVFDNSMVTEFVLYDIAHARQSVSAQELLKGSSDATPPKGTNQGIIEGSNESDLVKFKEQSKIAFSNKSNPYPWASGDLHPNLEIAAFVIEVPFEKRESLKYKGNKISDKMHSNLLNLSMVEHRRKDRLESKFSEKVKVVIPTGNHGLPSAESQGPSSLLDRWRLGGGCDCGGWDMACPLTVFSNPNIHCAEDRPLLDNQLPFELFVKVSFCFDASVAWITKKIHLELKEKEIVFVYRKIPNMKS